MRVIKQWNRLPREVVDENIQCQSGWGSEPPALVADVPACCRGLDWVAFKGFFQPKLFYNSPEWSISHKDELVRAWVFCQELLQDLPCNSVLYRQAIFVLHICCFPSLFFTTQGFHADSHALCSVAVTTECKAEAFCVCESCSALADELFWGSVEC